MAKTICRAQHTKKNRCRKNGDKNRKALYKLINNAFHGKTMENIRNKTDLKFVSNKKVKRIICSGHQNQAKCPKI